MPRNELEIVLRLRDEATRALKRAQGALKGLEGELKRAKAAAARLNAELEAAAPHSLKLAAAVSAAGASLAGLGVKAIATAGQFEQMRIAFTTMLGSAEKADRFLRELYDFAAKTPFEIEGLQQQVQLLLALGFKAEEVIPTLRAVGDAVAALGGSSALLDRVVLALGQIRAKGKVSAEEMRQLAEAGIPAWEMLAKKIGVDIPTAMKLAQQGAIDAATGVSAILEGMQERFAGMMELQSRTLLGIWSNIKDNLTRTLAALGEDLDRTFHVREGMQAFLAWLDRVRAWFEGGGIRRFLREHARSIFELAGAITGALLPALVQAIRGLALFAARLAPWAAAGYAAVKALEALGVSLADLKRWAALGAQAISGLGKIFQAVVADAAGVIAFWRRALSGMMDAFRRALFFLDRAWKAIQERNIAGARFALQTAATALSGSLAQAFDAATQQSAVFFDRANKLAEDGLTRLFMTMDGTLGETARATQKAFSEIVAGARQLSKSLTALAGGGSAPIPQLNAGLEQTGDKADQAKDKILSLNEAIRRQLDLLGQTAPRVAEYAQAFLGVVSPREEAPTASGGQTPTWLFRMPGYRRRHGGLRAEMRAQAEAEREALEAASKLTDAERDRRQALAEIRAEQKRLNELEKEHLELQQSLLRARQMEIARMRRLLAEASKLTAAEADRRRAARELGKVWTYQGQLYREHLQYQRSLLRAREMEIKKAEELTRKERERLRLAERYVSTIQTVYSGLNRVLSSFSKVGKDTGAAIRDLWGGFADLAKAIPVVGGLLSKVFSFFGSIAEGLYKLTWQATVESLNRARAAYEKLGEQMVLIHQRAYARIKKYQERYFFGLISVDRYKVEVDKFALKIAQTLEQGVLGGLRNAMRAFLEGAQDWQEQLKEGLRSAIENAVIEAVIQGAIFKGVLGEALTKLTEALAKGNYEAARTYVRDIAAQVPELTKKIAGVLEPFRREMAGLRGGKSGGEGGLTTPGTQTIRYELPTAPVLAAPAWVDEMGRHVAKFGEAVDRFAKARISVDVRLSGDLAYSVRGLA